MFYTVNDEILRDYNNDIIEDQDEAIEAAIDEHITFDDYDRWIDELDGVINVLGTEYDASYILKNISPCDYRLGYTDFTEWLRSDANYELDRHGECFLCDVELIAHEDDDLELYD